MPVMTKQQQHQNSQRSKNQVQSGHAEERTPEMPKVPQASSVRRTKTLEGDTLTAKSFQQDGEDLGDDVGPHPFKQALMEEIDPFRIDENLK